MNEKHEINLKSEKLPGGALHRLASLALALVMALSLLPAVTIESDADYSDPAIDKLLNWGVMSGYPDGSLHPERSLTRAEFVAMVNRAYGFTEMGNTPFIDVPANAWFHDDINIAYTAKYFNGVSPRMAGPDQELTREQAMVLLARNLRLDPVDGEVTEFADGHVFSDWSRGYARAAHQAGIVGGYTDGSYKPKNNITRGEMAVMLQRSLGTLINQSGTHTLSDVYGNVTVNSPNTVLKDSTIAGDLYITGGLNLGDVTLENVRVLGSIIVAGGGESQSGESITLRNVQADSIKVDSIADQYVSLAAEGDTVIGEAILRSDAYMQDRTRPGEGFLNITLDSVDPNATFTLSGNLESVVNKTPGSTLNIAVGTVDTLVVDEMARDSTLNLDINSTAMNLNLDTGVNVTGVGDIEKLSVNAPGANVEMLPDSVTIRPGLVADVAGQTMNAQQAKESSADPRLLAGYPKVKNVAPKEGTGVYSTNKGGTVYWAVSSTINGSVGEEELISPTKDNKNVTVTGSTPIEKSETEYTSTLDKLTPDSNYYLSTVLVDARGRHSPVKVVSFLTPDDTDPKFSQGYPVVKKNYCESVVVSGVVQRDDEGFPKRNYRVQVAAMPTKTCQLYYALYPKGSTAPTAQQFRSGGIGTPIRSGVEDATKNRINYIELSGLEELTEYDIYLCYIDADGTRSSPVQKLSFKTVDGKPPRFQYETPAVTQEQLNGLRLSVNVNEAARVYWVVSKDNNYIKTNDSWTETEWWERACRQIESGTNGVKSGSVNVAANTEGTLNISGLEPATHYYIYFVAKDNAGNYSEFFSDTEKNTGKTLDPAHPELYTPHNEQPYKYYITASTLDNIPPEARQEFSNCDKTDPTKPYADTDIKIIFSEAVMQYTTHRDKAQENFKSLYNLYNDVLKAQASGDTQAIKDAKEAYYDTLRTTIRLYNNASTGNDSVRERDDNYVHSDTNPWVIDYRNVTVSYDADTGEMTVLFPTNAKDSSKSALNLSSGSTYHFVLEDLCDTSSSKNRMGRYPLPDFTTISAQVQLRSIEVTNVNYRNYADSSTGVVENIPIDMAFSLTPVSTSVEKNVNWDMIFWSDTSCEFEVYEITSESNGSDAVAIRPLEKNGEFSKGTAGHYSVPQNAENLEAPDPDTTADNYLGYVGQSYFNMFYGVNNTFPSVTGVGNVLCEADRDAEVNKRAIMEREKSKYYGIHITKIGSVSETEGRGKIWDASISFRVSVVTGKSGDLGDLAAVLRNDTIRAFEQSRGISLIHSPKPFTLYKRFANQDAPEFADRFPTFSPADVTASMTVMLDRPGTLYYAIVPASEWHNESGNSTQMYATYDPAVKTYTVDSGAAGATVGVQLHEPRKNLPSSDDNYERYYALIEGSAYNVPKHGSDKIIPAYDANNQKYNVGDTASYTSKLLLTTPSSQSVYSQNLASTTGVRTGSMQLGSGRETITVEGLEPETVYLAFFSMQGTGQVYSKRAQVFQFTTTKISRPRLVVYNQTDTAAIATKNMDAEVDVALFLLDSLDKNVMLNTYLKNVIEDKEKDDFTANYLQGQKDRNGKLYSEYKVWEAIISSYGDTTNGGSLFDQYANEDAKKEVAKLIRQDGGSTLVRVAGGTGTLKLGDDATTFSYIDKMEPLPTQYILLAVAHATGKQGQNASGHSLGFAGTSPLYKGSAEKPTIKSISGTIYADFDKGKDAVGGFLLTGSLRITFSTPLYLFYGTDSVSSLTRREALTGQNVAQYFIEPDTLPALEGRFTPQASGNTALQSLTVNLREITGYGVGGVENNQSFYVNERLCSQFGSPRQGVPLQIRIHYDPDTQKVTVSAGTNATYAKEWYPNDGQVTFDITGEIRPPAESFSLDRTSLSLKTGDSGTINATIDPSGSSGKIDYSWKSGSGLSTVGDIERLKSDGSSIRVTGLKVDQPDTKGIIVATLKNGSTVVKTEEITVYVSPQPLTTVKVTPVSAENITLSATNKTIKFQISIESDDLTEQEKRLKNPVIKTSGGSTYIDVTPTISGSLGTVQITRKSAADSLSAPVTILVECAGENATLVSPKTIWVTVE